ncbi:MAG TPA: DJ-1/PfpI family protein [Acetobacteraceae bacterium]|nr:DJ-1/PfpI family protein [Acetobacteraceae bacterium]
MPATTIGLVLFPRMTQLDLTGPLEVFTKLPDAEVLLLWKTLQPVEAESGLRLLPYATLRDHKPLDVVCVPGGAGVNALMEDADVLDWLRKQASHARYVSSVCTGALVLGAAGLLHGKRATTHWAYRDLLSAFGAIPTPGRVVRDGNLFSGGGVTAGIDFALTMAAELAGPVQAQSIQLQIEYAPAPPFDAGTPDAAPPEVLRAVQAATAVTRAEREAIVARAAARLAATGIPV